MARPLSFRWDEDLIARIDEARGLVPRSAFVRACVEQALAGDGKAWIAPTGAERLPTEADREMFRQPARDMLPRSSSQAKRGTGPRPKGTP